MSTDQEQAASRTFLRIYLENLFSVTATLPTKLTLLISRILRNQQKQQSFIRPTFLNESVNFEKQCIFIAIPKTGTSTVRSQLIQKGVPLIPNPHLNIMQVRDSLYVYILISALGRNKTFPTELILDDKQLRSKASEVFTTFFKFAAVRNPWARAISLYHRHEGIKLKDKIPFEEFCDKHIYASDTCVHPTLHKNQIDWLSDENGECIMDYIYKVENIDIAIKEIEELTNGRLKLISIKANVNPNVPSRDYKDLYSDKTRKIIAKRFQKDIDYFKYTF